MSYRIERSEPVSVGIKRIAKEQLDKAIESIRHADDNEHEAIHDVRKRFKKVRAVIRLVRDEVGKKTYKQENTYYRDLGRKLSNLRDASSMIETLNQLKKTYQDPLSQDAFDKAYRSLLSHRQNLSKEKLEEQNILNVVKHAIKDGAARIDEWPIEEKSFDVFDKSIKRVYKRGYRALPAAYSTRYADDFHELRKRVKYLWYINRILKQLWHEPIKGFARELHKLGDFLGDEHDLAVLKEKVNEGYINFKDDNSRELLLKLIEEERFKLQEKAHPLAMRIYYQEPGDYVYQFRVYWNAMQEELRKENERVKN